MRLRRFRPAVLLILSASVTAWWPGAQAAPTTETAPATPAAETAPASILNGGAVKSGSRSGETSTIDMLVEMQQPAAGIQFNERQRAAEARARGLVPPATTPPQRPAWQAAPATPSPAPGSADAPPVSQAGLFGTGAAPQVHQAQQATARTALPSGAVADGSAAPAARSVSADADNPTLSRWLALPRELISYVRENRGTVLGSVAGLLAAAWVGSLLVSRLRG